MESLDIVVVALTEESVIVANHSRNRKLLSFLFSDNSIQEAQEGQLTDTFHNIIF
jgi:hypothetical protein